MMDVDVSMRMTCAEHYATEYEHDKLDGHDRAYAALLMKCHVQTTAT